MDNVNSSRTRVLVETKNGCVGMDLDDFISAKSNAGPVLCSNDQKSRVVDSLMERMSLYQSNPEYDDELISLKAKYNVFSKNYDKIVSENSKLKDSVRGFRKTSLILFFVSLVFLIIIVSLLFLIFKLPGSENKPALSTASQYSSGYSAGYNDAVSGSMPSKDHVQCYSCGYSDPDYNQDFIYLHKINNVWIPICEDCMSDATPLFPITIMGEEYYFNDISTD